MKIMCRAREADDARIVQKKLDLLHLPIADIVDLMCLVVM